MRSLPHCESEINEIERLNRLLPTDERSRVKIIQSQEVTPLFNRHLRKRKTTPRQQYPFRGEALKFPFLCREGGNRVRFMGHESAI